MASLDPGFDSNFAGGKAAPGQVRAEHSSPEREIWCAVLNRAFVDGHWSYFCLANEDFVEVCNLAGIDPAYMVRKAHENWESIRRPLDYNDARRARVAKAA